MRNIWHLRIKQLRIKHSRVTYAINPVNGTPLRHISPSDSDRVLFDACTPAHNTSCCHTTRSSSSSSSSSLGEDLRPTSIQDKIRAHLPVMESLFIQYVTSRVKYWNGGHSSKSWWRNVHRGVLSRFLLWQWRGRGWKRVDRGEAGCICWSSTRICWLDGINLRIVEKLHLLYIVEKLHECFQVSRILVLNRGRESGKICMDIAKSAISRIAR